MDNVVTNILKDIETRYPVDTILVDGKQVWPLLRVEYAMRYIFDISNKWGEAVPVENRLHRLIRAINNSLYGFNNWFGNYEYIALSDTMERRNIEGVFWNKLLDPVIDRIGADKVLLIENPVPGHYPAGKVHTRHVVSMDMLMLAIAYQFAIPHGIKIENQAVLESIKNEYSLKVDDKRSIKWRLALEAVYRYLFKKFGPKAILLSDSYGPNLSAIKAAKALSIPVIECQHGVIGKEHLAYNVHIELDKNYFPDYLLVFGKKDIEVFENSLFIQPQNVVPVGSFYIEYVKRNHKKDPALVERVGNYGRSVGISLAWITDQHTMDFVRQAALIDEGILYILIPRTYSAERYGSLNLPVNVMVIADKNFHETMLYVDFHATVFSSCALEAPSLGVQNIFINFDDLSRQYYGSILRDSRVTRYAGTPAEFVEIINTFEKLDRDTICKLNEDIIATNYEENIGNFVATFLH
jgi:hypothetical protein